MDDFSGLSFGAYRLTRLLAQGENAQVYAGEHERTSSQVAVKVPYRPHTRATWEQLLAEARLLARFDHPHIVHLLDVGEQVLATESVVYLVLEYAPSGTLREQHPKGTCLPLQKLLSYVAQIAAALQYLHDRRVIHRDIKPEHMLMGAQEQLLLCGFGAALSLQDAVSQKSLPLVGTLAYMAPEQLQGHASPASDQYALGCVVYEWLTGAPPFRGPFAAISQQHTGAVPAPIVEKRPQIPLAIAQVVMTALEKEPELRFPHVLDFANALEQAYATVEQHA
ncbi:MAG: serine/threonine protein kinase [Ktedonobacteraceae bacterium]|nr:serine/threonine protein kinase [Ktedonobacteraceae bacterium]